MASLQLLLVAGVCVASLRAWLQVLQVRATQAEGLFPLRFHEPPPIPAAPFTLALACLTVLIAGPALQALEWVIGLPSAPPRDIGVFDVQVALAVDMLMVAVMLSAMAGSRANLHACGIRGDDIRGQIADGWFGFQLSIGPVFVVLIVSSLLQIRDNQPEHAFLRLLVEDGSLVNWFWIGITAVIAAPLAEELLFRVLLQGWLEKQTNPAVAICGSSLLFCLVHQFPDSVGLIPLALVLGWVHHRRRSYLAVVLLHAAFNALNLLLAATTEPPPPA